MRALAAVAFVASLLPAVALAESSVNCDRGIVALGDATIDLLGKCGAPTLREARVDERWTTAHAASSVVTRRAAIGIERWTYDFGPNQFLVFVTLRGGRVTAIERGGYGYARAEPAAAPVPRARCEPEAIRVGDSTIDLLNRCGEPALLDERQDEETVEVRPAAKPGRADGASTPAATVVGGATVRARLVEIWTYDFGPQIFVRLVRVENGTVTRIRTGSYGYSAR